MLPLDDPRWMELDHRGWAYGARYGLDPEAPFVPDELGRLLEQPSDIERFDALWPYLCSEGSAYPAAYAAAPYVIEFAKRVLPEQRIEYLYFLGLVVRCTYPKLGGLKKVESYLVEDYRRALDEALPLLWETLAGHHTPRDTRYLLATAASLKGHPRLGEVLDNLDCISEVCPRCGEHVYPDELQRMDDDAEAGSW